MDLKQDPYGQRPSDSCGRRLLRRTQGVGPGMVPSCAKIQHHHLEQKTENKKVLSAKELTGAPLISLVPKYRKTLKKKISEPLERDKGKIAEIGRTRQSNQTRLRHRSEQAVEQVLPESGSLPYLYQGPHIYHKLLSGQHTQHHIQDFYENPEFKKLYWLPGQYSSHSYSKLHNVEDQQWKSHDNLSDSESDSSEDEDNFIPRIIKPRRRRKKEKKAEDASLATRFDAEETLCLGSEKQWLPTGLLSAESCLDSRSETGGSEEEDIYSNVRHGARRKLGTTMSVPLNIGFRTTKSSNPQEIRCPESDYVSMTSVSSSSTTPSSSSSSDQLLPSSSSSDQLFDSDSGLGSTAEPQHLPLKESKSVSCSYFRSPKTESRRLGGSRGYHSLEKGKQTHKHQAGGQLPLRKTNSWAFTGSTGGRGSEFSLFSPLDSCDLLSGVRKDLSRLDIRDESL